MGLIRERIEAEQADAPSDEHGDDELGDDADRVSFHTTNRDGERFDLFLTPFDLSHFQIDDEAAERLLSLAVIVSNLFG